MDDYPVIDDTYLSELKPLEFFKNEPEFIRIEIDPGTRTFSRIA